MGAHAIQRTLGLLAVGLALVTALGVIAGSATADSTHPAHKIQKTQASVKDLGPSTGLLPPDHLTLESAIQVDLDKETARLPLYKGTANGETVWFVLEDASDAGMAHNLGVNFAPKLANLAIGCPQCVQTVTIDSPTPAQNPFGQAVVHFQGAPDFSPTGSRSPGRTASHWRTSRPVQLRVPVTARSSGSMGPRSSTALPSWRQVMGHSTSNITPTPTTARWPSTSRRRRPRASSSSPGSTCFSSRASMPASRSSTSAPTPASSSTAVLERSTYVPALDQAAYNGGDDFLGSAHERLFGFVNGQTGANNPEAQGFVHLVKDGHAAEDASASNTALIDALRNGGDLLNVFGDFPTLSDPRHAQAYSPLWDAQLGVWTDKAIQQGLDKRQVDEVVVFNLAAKRPT